MSTKYKWSQLRRLNLAFARKECKSNPENNCIYHNYGSSRLKDRQIQLEHHLCIKFFVNRSESASEIDWSFTAKEIDK